MPSPFSKFYARLKAANTTGQRPKKRDFTEMLLTFIGAFAGLAAVGFLESLPDTVSSALHPSIIASFGATAVLIYGSPSSPLAQPVCVVFGNVVSALIGVSISKVIGLMPYDMQISHITVIIGSALAVALSTVAMQYLRILHPPGGATAFIAVIGDEHIKQHGYYYVISPVLIGNVVLILFAVLINNLSETTKYPQYWIHPNPEANNSIIPEKQEIQVCTHCCHQIIGKERPESSDSSLTQILIL